MITRSNVTRPRANAGSVGAKNGSNATMGIRDTASTRTDEEPEVYARALDSLRAVCPRTEISLTEVPAPRNLAPHAASFTAIVAQHDRELGGGQLVLLYDPAGQEGWEGAFRLVSYLHAEVDPEMAEDPPLERAAWSWLTDTLTSYGAPYRCLGGTVTRSLSESFGTLGHRAGSAEVELRASWSPGDPECGVHVRAWCEVLAAAAGLPPALPSGPIPARSD